MKDQKDPTPKRPIDLKVKEELLSPVNDPGFYPYDRRANALPDTVCDVQEPDDPMGFVPPYRTTRNEED